MKYDGFQGGAFNLAIGDTYLVLDPLTPFFLLIALLIPAWGIWLVFRNDKLSRLQKFNWLALTIAFPVISPVIFFFYRRRLS